MPLKDEVFSLASIAQLGSFDCGDTISGKAATEWIFCSNPANSAATSMQKGTQVWLYRDDAGRLVGMGSLGPTGRTISGALPPLALIPQFGVDKTFHQFPTNSSWEDRYSTRIFVDLLYKARELGYRSVFLLVHKTSHGAIKLYQRLGFVIQGNEKNGYLPMIVKLADN